MWHPVPWSSSCTSDLLVCALYCSTKCMPPCRIPWSYVKARETASFEVTRDDRSTYQSRSVHHILPWMPRSSSLVKTEACHVTSKALVASKYVMHSGWPLSFVSASTSVTSRVAKLEDESVKPRCCEDCVLEPMLPWGGPWVSFPVPFPRWTSLWYGGNCPASYPS